MKMTYSKPELEIREYNFVQDSILTTSEVEIDKDKDLNGGDTYNPFSNKF